MVRKILSFSGVLVLVGIIIVSFLFIKKQEEYKDIDVFLGVPIGATSILYINDSNELLDKLNVNNKLWKEFKKISFIKDFNFFSNTLDTSIVKMLPVIINEEKRSVCISSHFIGNRKMKLLFSVPMLSYSEENIIRRKINALSKEGNSTLKRKYSDVNIFLLEEKNQSINIAFLNGIMLISSSSILIEESIRQLQSDVSINNISSFINIKNTRGKNVDANIYVNIERLANSFSLVGNRDLNALFKRIKNIGSWLSLDLVVNKNNLSLSGFHSNKLGELMNLCARQEPVNLSVDEIAPADTQLLISMSISDANKYRKDLNEYLTQTKISKSHTKLLNKCIEITGVNPEDLLYSLKLQEIALVVTGNTDKDKFCILKFDNSELVKEKMIAFVDSYASKQSVDISSLKKEYVLDSNNKFYIYSLPETLSISKIFGDIFELKGRNCFTIIDNYLVFSNSVKELKLLINNKILENTLNNNSDYNKIEDSYSYKSNVFVYCNMSSYIYNFSKLFKRKISKQIISNSKYIKKFKNIGLQLIVEKDFMYHNMFLDYDSIQTVKPHKLWATKLDTIFNHTPIVLPSHKFSKSICLIQDVTNKLYFINAVGAIVATKQLNSEIVGDVHAIDYYNNGKIQYMFSTKDEIHCIGIDGKNVASYPLYLNYQTQKGISVFSYDTKKNYRIFVPSGKKIYVYTKDAKRVTGWKFKGTKDKIIRKIQYFRVDSKDYIVLADENKTYILNRKGEERLILKKDFKLSSNNKYYLHTNTPEKGKYLVTSAKNGDIISIYFDGNVKVRKMNINNSSHTFIPVDVNGNKIEDYIYSYNNTIKIFSDTYKILLEKKFKLSISFPPQAYFFDDKFIGIGVCLEKLNKSYLFDIKGNNFKGFPLNGNTPMIILSNKKTDSTFKTILGDNANYLFSYNID